jgi:hypothetical protein
MIKIKGKINKKSILKAFKEIPILKKQIIKLRELEEKNNNNNK